MQLKRILVTLFFLCSVWSLFLFGKFFIEEKPIQNLSHLPENSIFAMRLDGSSAVKSTLFSILLEANDPEVIDVINEQISRKWKRKGVNKNLGIDFLSDIVVYVFPFEEEQILGITYNLKRPDLMRKNAMAALDSTQVYAINENVGVVLSMLGKKGPSINQRTKMIGLAKKIAFNPAENDLAKKIAEKKTDKFIQLTSQGMLYGSSTLFTRMDMDLNLEKHSLVLEGQMIKNAKTIQDLNNSNYTLVPSGMHLFTKIIPKSVQDTLQHFLTKVQLKLPQLDAIAMNYRGVQINNPEGILIYSPDMDLVLNFKKPVDFIQELKKSQLLSGLNMRFKDASTLTNGVKEFYLKKVNNQSYLFTSRKSATTKLNAKDCLLCAEGKMTNLSQITGDKWVLMFLNSLPFYYNTENFFSKTKGLKVMITNTDKQRAKIEGRFDFKEAYYPMNEFFKYAVQNNLIRLK